MRDSIFWIMVLIILTLTACGLPDEGEISKSIHNGKKYTNEKSWDRAWDEAKNIDDYLHVISYRYDKKKVNNLDKQVEELQKAIVVMNKEKSKKKWDKVEKTWDETKLKEEKHGN